MMIMWSKDERSIGKSREGETGNLIHSKGNAVYFIFCFKFSSNLNMKLELLQQRKNAMHFGERNVNAYLYQGLIFS